MQIKALDIKVDELKEIGLGTDSTVFLIDEETVLKVYSNLQSRLGYRRTPFEIFEVVHNYKDKTDKAIQILDSVNRKKQISLNEEKYTLEPIIIPQGETYLNSDGFVCSLGQEYIQGFKFGRINGFSDGVIKHAQSEYIIPDENPALDDLVMNDLSISAEFDIFKEFSFMFVRINQSLGTNFSFSLTNMKLTVDSVNKIIYAKITDLAADIM